VLLAVYLDDDAGAVREDQQEVHALAGQDAGPPSPPAAGERAEVQVDLGEQRRKGGGALVLIARAVGREDQALRSVVAERCDEPLVQVAADVSVG
jgi:hypothetical protein